MNGTFLFWVIMFALSAILFFGTAVVITIVGIRDLRDLLKRSVTRESPD